MSQNPALRAAEKDTFASLLEWTQEVIEGRGNSASQMLVTVVLGCIPYVGQAVDAYNILRCLYALTKSPSSPEKWMDLVLSLLALIPLFGDALKNIVMMMRQGRPLGRILDALPNRIRGNQEAWFRQIDWAKYGRDLSREFSSLMGKLIAALDNMVARGLLGREGVNRLVSQLRQLEQQGGRRIREAMAEIQRLHQRTLAMALPTTTASSVASSQRAASASRSRAQSPARDERKRPPPGSSAPGNVSTTTRGTATPANGQVSATQRQSERSNLSRHMTGVTAEHIADYYFVRYRHSRKKVNRNGSLYEMRQSGHQGIDHVWHDQRLPSRYRISDTKGTAGAGHKLESIAQVASAIEFGIEVMVGATDENRISNAVGNTRHSGRQMSHLWIAKRIKTAELTSQARADLLEKVEDWEASGFNPGITPCPYDRSLITVVGANLNRHHRAGQPVSSPCRIPAVRHQISAEFILPVHVLMS